MTDAAFQALYLQSGQVFTPGSPVNERDLFSGRIEQFQKVLDTVSQRGYHAIVYGERGVGKTSLANIISDSLRGSGGWLIPRVNCDASDTFSSVWRKALQDILISRQQHALGFTGEDQIAHSALVDSLPADLTPDMVRRVLADLARGTVLLVIFDEFDRLRDKVATSLMSDTIKGLSDYGVGATILLIGVADSVDDLIEGHRSIERALVQIPMPRMSNEEIRQILAKGLERLGLTASRSSVDEIVSLSQGLPYIAHLLGLNSVRSAIMDQRLKLTSSDIDTGMRAAVENWQQSIKTSYYDATKSQQPGHIFKEVLLACSLAVSDELGYFTAAAVRSPLRILTNKNYDIPNFARHLKEVSEPGRGEILQRVGETRRIRYRFSSPLMRPYIVMRGFADNLISKEKLQMIEMAKVNVL